MPVLSRSTTIRELIILEEGFLFHSVLASMIMIRASMAGTTLAHRYSKSDEPVRPSVLLVVILLSTILLLTRNWIFLSIELNLLWLSDDLLSWKRLSHHPGSWFAGLSSAPIVWHIWRGDFYEWLEQWHRKQGSIVRESHVHPVCLSLLTPTQVLDPIDSRHLMQTSFANWTIRSSGAQDLDGMELLLTRIRSTNLM